MRFLQDGSLDEKSDELDAHGIVRSCGLSVFLRDSSAAPTSAEAAIKAIWFMHSTAVIIGVDPKTMGSRISGVCRDMFMQKRTLKQVPCFTAEAVLALEEFAIQFSQTSFCFAFMSAAELEMLRKSGMWSLPGTTMFSW